MPMYPFRCHCCSKSFEVYRPMRDASLPAGCPVCLHAADRDWSITPQTRVKASEHSAGFGNKPCNTWPLRSNAFRVANPRQMQEHLAFNERRGVKTEYDKDRRPIFTGPRHKKRFLEARGAVDPDAGCSGAMGSSQHVESPHRARDAADAQQEQEIKREAKQQIRARARALGVKV